MTLFRTLTLVATAAAIALPALASAHDWSDRDGYRPAPVYRDGGYRDGGYRSDVYRPDVYRPAPYHPVAYRPWAFRRPFHDRYEPRRFHDDRFEYRRGW